jgi:hypothetical protein
MLNLAVRKVTARLLKGSLLTDRNQTYTASSACAKSDSYEVPEKSFQWKPRYTQSGILFSK